MKVLAAVLAFAAGPRIESAVCAHFVGDSRPSNFNTSARTTAGPCPARPGSGVPPTPPHGQQNK